MRVKIIELTLSERIDWLRLIRSPNVGPVTFYQLLDRFGSATAALEALPELARRGGRRGAVETWPKSAAERELADLEASGARLLASCEPAYSPALLAIHDPPPLLSVQGRIALLHQPAMGVVGARNASGVGHRFTRQIAGELAAAGYPVVSGLARGIDTAAHTGALAGGTIAVLAGGIDIVYPPENQDLYERIAETGLLVAEMPVGTRPQGRHFPRRNRLISGLALGLLVVEAALRSGSLITARLAAEQGREVFAVPGSPLDPRARGTNRLIRNGAVLTEGLDDILPVLADMAQRRLREPGPERYEPASGGLPDDGELATARAAVVEKLGPVPVEVDELIRQCHLTASAVLTILLELELAGRLERHPGHKVSLG